MKPCDCKDMEDVKKLQEQGCSFNDDRLVVAPNCVELTVRGIAMIKIPMHRFKQFAEWFLSEQDEFSDKPTERDAK